MEGNMEEFSTKCFFKKESAREYSCKKETVPYCISSQGVKKGSPAKTLVN